MRGEVPLIGVAEVLDYMDAVRGRALAVLERAGDDDSWIFEMVIQHEHQHTETMLQCIQLADARLYSPAPRERTGV